MFPVDGAFVKRGILLSRSPEILKRTSKKQIQPLFPMVTVIHVEQIFRFVPRKQNNYNG